MDLTRLYGTQVQKLNFENIKKANFENIKKAKSSYGELQKELGINDSDLAKVAKNHSMSVSDLKKELSSGLYKVDEKTHTLEASGKLSTSDLVNSYVKTAVDLGLGYGIGKTMSLDTKDSDGAVVVTALSAQILGSLIEGYITKPYITKPKHELLSTRHNLLDYAYIFTNAYHGYTRNNESIVYGATWGLSSLFVGAELMGAAMSQGFGKKLIK
ncbi:MAG: hypothetical protein HON29_02350 [Candidatus Magasanikbacteria bacterium]|jgi:hypothetical protein|nr:hypothetical protein [Candidatus Magasanikbacteria bacterium]